MNTNRAVSNMTEEWSRWEPIDNIKGKFFIKDFHLSDDGLKILLYSLNDDTKIEVFFDGSIAAYRYTNESWCFNIFGELSKKYNDSFYVHWSFFKIENSDYIKSLSPLSAGTSESTHFYHFAFLGDDEIIDVLATYEPEVTLIS